MKKRSYRIDPENIEPNTLLEMSGPLAGKRILEVGCGSGRLTWRYAKNGMEIVGIDPNQKDIKTAMKDNPYTHVHFISADILDYTDPKRFDIVLLSWSL